MAAVEATAARRDDDEGDEDRSSRHEHLGARASSRTELRAQEGRRWRRRGRRRGDGRGSFRRRVERRRSGVLDVFDRRGLGLLGQTVDVLGRCLLLRRCLLGQRLLHGPAPGLRAHLVERRTEGPPPAESQRCELRRHPLEHAQAEARDLAGVESDDRRDLAVVHLVTDRQVEQGTLGRR